MLRNGNLSANPLMDSLTYFYTEGANRLDHIRDQYNESTAHNSNYIPRIDLKDQLAGSYTYDAIGNLKSSAWMGDDDIKWNIYGKVAEVEKRALAGVTSRFIHYYYDPSGNKTGETVRHGSGGTAYYNHRWYVRDAQGNTLATYEVNNAASASAGTLKLREHYLYGSSRLGIINRDQDVDANKLTAVDETNLGDTYLLNFTRGNKLFELTNHLGNVLTVLSDKKTGRPKTGDPSMIGIYDFDMVTAADYTPFGMVMLGRNFSFLSRYRYGFNGQELDNEVKGAGNLYTAKFWAYDPLVGRRWNLDPRPTVGISEYSVFFNNPIRFNDPLGDTSGVGTRIWGGLKTVGGLAEMVVGGVGGAATSWTGVGALAGGAAVMHGADVTSAGLRQIWTGEETSTFTQQGISKGLQAAGVSKSNAEIAAGYTDAGISILLSAGAGMAKDATFVATRPVFQIARAETQAAKAGDNIALGVSEHLDDFAKSVGGSTWRTWGAKDFQSQFLQTINNSANKIHFNLNGISNPWGAVSEGAKGFGASRATSWELYQLYSNPAALERTIFYQGGKVVPNPFK